MIAVLLPAHPLVVEMLAQLRCVLLFPSPSIDNSCLFQDPSVIFEETDQDAPVDAGQERSGKQESVCIQVEGPSEHGSHAASTSPSARKLLDVDEEFKGYTMTRSHSISSSSDISRLDGTPSKTPKEEVAKSLSAHSLTDVSVCDNPSCQIKNRSHRHSTPGRLCSYLRLCSVVDLPALGTYRLCLPQVTDVFSQDRRAACSALLLSLARHQHPISKTCSSIRVSIHAHRSDRHVRRIMFFDRRNSDLPVDSSAGNTSQFSFSEAIGLLLAESNEKYEHC